MGLSQTVSKTTQGTQNKKINIKSITGGFSLLEFIQLNSNS